MKKFIFLASLWTLSLGVFAQHDSIFESNPAILKKIEQWQDLKFGFMMHWGAYSQWGVVESWSICSEDEDWCGRNGANYNEYVAKYKALNTTFNPTQFDPAKWADLAYKAGMRYVIFTTKHHDGFCMFGTKQTHYSIADKSCPFSKDPRADVTKEILNAFRAKGFWAGTYFSKPDWNSNDYWAPEWGVADRNVNYDPKKHPDRWQKFSDFTYNQIEELMSNYGKIDILWLDGGWVRPEWSLNEETRPWIGCKGWIQDVNMPKIASMARQHQPNLLIVDRSVHGKYENYRTPEQQIPEKPLSYPWETCLTMGDSWSFTPKDKYKSTNKLIHLLVDIVSKGGNLLLNVGPGPDGNLPAEACKRMEEIGKWMDINSICIYKSSAISPYKSGKVCFTQLKDGSIYGIYLADENETKMPETIDFSGLDNLKQGKIKLLGSKTAVSLKKTASGYQISVPKSLQANPPCKDAWVFQLK